MGQVSFGRRVGLVPRDDDGPPRFPQQLRDVAVDGREALSHVEQQDDDVRLVDRDPGLRLDRRPGRILCGVKVKARGIHGGELAAPPLGDAIEPVASQARLRVDDRLLPADQTVEEGRFADVRTAHDRHDWSCHASIRRVLAAAPTEPRPRSRTEASRARALPPGRRTSTTRRPPRSRRGRLHR